MTFESSGTVERSQKPFLCVLEASCARFRTQFTRTEAGRLDPFFNNLRKPQ